MTVDFCYRLVQFIVNKNQSGYVSPSQFNLVINQAQQSFIDYLLGEFQTYQPTRPFARVQFGENQQVRQRLTPVIYGFILNVDTTGFSPYPGDFQQVDAMWSIYGYNRIRYVQQDQHWFVYGSVIDPYQTNPYYMIEDLGFRFYPNNIGQTRMSYVRTPPDIIWGYTLDGNNRPVYNPITSQDPIWYDTDLLEIITRALRMVGVNLQAQVVSQYADEITKTGQ